MDIVVKTGDLTTERADALVVNLFKDSESGGATGAVDEALDGLLSEEMGDVDFKADRGKTLVVRATDGIAAKRVIVVGLGARDDFDEEAVRIAAAASLQAAKSVRAKTVVSILHGTGEGGLDPERAGRAMTEGFRLAAYEFTRYKSDKTKKKIEEKLPKTVTVVSTNDGAVKAARKGSDTGEITARGTLFARDLVNVPGQHMPPKELVAAAKKVAKDSKRLDIEVHDKKALEKMGAGGILGVAQGSDHDPYLVHLTYKPKKPKKRVALVGKAITFDSGGLSIKPSKYMETMKLDMAGAAAVLGACSVLDDLDLSVEVHVIFGAAENMVSGSAIRPGDVLTAMNGKTIEVLNTDAEGRLTLADTLTYAQRQEPDVLIDAATLTGACLVALGSDIAGLMSNNTELATAVERAAKDAGEKMWRLPLEQSYKKQLKSPIAEIKNISSGRYGGAIIAGLFLSAFVDDDQPWVHIDLAGPSFAEKPLNAYTKKGSTGFGVRTLLTYLDQAAQQ